jgi:cytochrome c biogenesis protein
MGAGTGGLVWTGLQRLAAPQLMLLFFLLAATGALWVIKGDAPPTQAMLPALVVLVVNLTAAIITHRRFRTDLSLLVFHLALLVFVVLLFVARLTYLDGQAAVTRNEAFNGSLVKVNQGPWHRNQLQSVRFVNLDFTDEYPLNGNGYLTFNSLRWWDETGKARISEIGDDLPLVINGYRFYASRKGFAPRLIWQHDSGEIHYADVKLGSIEPDGWFDGNSWPLPNGPTIWLHLATQIDYPQPGATRVNLGINETDSALVVRVGDKRYELRPGQSLELDGGVINYAKLDVWMGYEVVYDMTMPWLIAVCLIGIGSMVIFYAKRIVRPPVQDVT